MKRGCVCVCVSGGQQRTPDATFGDAVNAKPFSRSNHLHFVQGAVTCARRHRQMFVCDRAERPRQAQFLGMFGPLSHHFFFFSFSALTIRQPYSVFLCLRVLLVFVTESEGRTCGRLFPTGSRCTSWGRERRGEG